MPQIECTVQSCVTCSLVVCSVDLFLTGFMFSKFLFKISGGSLYRHSLYSQTGVL
uniref:Uncharacterized protein n=1 Tax=Anguilla anguilla TaxID=7936 RepID=A0A0E9XV15_ANGAN